jgi:sarcosine oxidase
MSSRDTEVVVVGAGVLGLSAARALAKRGREVVVCEQATVGHGNSGSKGSARIFRLGYDHPGYVRLAMAAQPLWAELEADAGVRLLTTTGQVTFGDDLEVLTASMDMAGARYEEMGPGEVAARFPVLDVPGQALFEPDSAVIAADAVLAALRSGAGIELRERTRVVRLDDDGRRVRVVLQTDGEEEELRASTVVVCAGPWTGPLVAGTVAGAAVGLQSLPTLEQAAYLAPRNRAIDDVPVFVERRQPWFYGLPVRPSGLVKISFHGAGPAVALDRLTGHRVDRPDPSLVAELSAVAARVAPGLDAKPVSTERCLYDNSPDGDFVIDRVGRIVIGSATSGHGFKFAPLLGRVLGELATGTAPENQLAADLERFRSGRLPLLRDRGGPALHP